MKLSPLSLLFIGGITLTAGDLFAAQLMKFGGNLNYIIVIILYLIGLMFLIQSYKKEDIAVASTILVIFNIVTLTIVGIVVFAEELSLTKIFGIALGLISVILLELGKKKVSST